MQTLSTSKSLFMGILILEPPAFFCYLLQPRGTPRDGKQKKDRQIVGGMKPLIYVCTPIRLKVNS